MVRRVRKWGNSLALRIPRDLASEIGLRADTPVEMRLVEGRLVVEPVPQPAFTLDELLSRVTESNVHREVGAEAPAGDEVW